MGLENPTFDREYYRRYYYDPRTAVTTRREMQARASLIAAFTQHVGLPVRRVLDAGCGTGLLRAPLKRQLPRADYVGLETSAYLCSRYGWEHGLIEEYRGTAAFDLVICYEYCNTSTTVPPRAPPRLRQALPWRALLPCPDASRLAMELRPQANGFQRASARRELVPAASAAPLSQIGTGFWLRRGAPLTVWELESRF